jgi:hypothetical protein
MGNGHDNPYDPARQSTFGGSPYTPPGAPLDVATAPAALPHSGMGIASFVIALVAGLGSLAVFVWAGYVGVTQPDLPDDSPVVMMIGLGMIAGAVLLFAGTVLGIAAMFQASRRKLFAVLGLVLNGLGVLFTGGIVALGVVAAS